MQCKSDMIKIISFLDLEIVQPSFSAMVSGLSSFAVYQLPKNLVSQGMEIRFRIQPNNMDQISLLAFLGQSGLHDPKSDHLAVTFVKGYIMLTWNLGNGNIFLLDILHK